MRIGFWGVPLNGSLKGSIGATSGTPISGIGNYFGAYCKYTCGSDGF